MPACWPGATLCDIVSPLWGGCWGGLALLLGGLAPGVPPLRAGAAARGGRLQPGRSWSGDVWHELWHCGLLRVGEFGMLRVGWIGAGVHEQEFESAFWGLGYGGGAALCG